MKQIKKFYRNRFKNIEDNDRSNDLTEKRNKIWKILCKHFFQKMINRKDTLMDIGAGYCEFINNINIDKYVVYEQQMQHVTKNDIAMEGMITTKSSSTITPDFLILSQALCTICHNSKS